MFHWWRMVAPFSGVLNEYRDTIKVQRQPHNCNKEQLAIVCRRAGCYRVQIRLTFHCRGTVGREGTQNKFEDCPDCSEGGRV